jgi:hypothetical protein
LAQIRLTEDPAAQKLFDLYLRSSTILEPKNVSPALLNGRLKDTDLAKIEELSLDPEFNNLVQMIESNENQWEALLDHPTPEMEVPEPWMKGDDISVTNQNARILKQMSIIKIFRPDRVIPSVKKLITNVLGDEASSI